jgi:hypothetical protein
MNDSPGLIQEEDEQVLDERAVMSEVRGPVEPSVPSLIFLRLVK